MRVVRAIQEDDEALLEQIVRLSRRLFAPLALTVGALAMLFGGLRLLLVGSGTMSPRAGP